MRKTENIINRTGINKTECKKTGHSKENKIPGVKCTPKIELYLSNFRGALQLLLISFFISSWNFWLLCFREKFSGLRYPSAPYSWA